MIGLECKEVVPQSLDDRKLRHRARMKRNCLTEFEYVDNSPQDYVANAS